MFRHFAWEREVMAVELETAEMICEPNSEKTWSNRIYKCGFIVIVGLLLQFKVAQTIFNNVIIPYISFFVISTR